jgi:hypothetical protein
MKAAPFFQIRSPGIFAQDLIWKNACLPLYFQQSPRIHWVIRILAGNVRNLRETIETAIS